MNSNLREILRCCSLLTIVLGNHKGFLALVLLEQQFSASESAPFPCFLEGEVELVESDAFATLLIPEGEGAEAGGGDMNDKDKFSLIPAQSLSFTSPPPAKADLLILPHPAFHQYQSPVCPPVVMLLLAIYTWTALISHHELYFWRVLSQSRTGLTYFSDKLNNHTLLKMLLCV